MTEETIKKLATQDLKNQKKGQNILLWALLGLTIALLFFPIYDITQGKEFEAFEFVMPLCTLAGAFTVWDPIRKINKELASRNL